MGKVTAPLLSFNASGSIAKTLVFSKWRGRQYTRQHVIPTYTNTTEQQKTRGVFAWLQAVYKYGTPEFLTAWDAYATGKVMTGRNAFGKFNISNMRSDTDLTNLNLEAGAMGGIPPAGASPAGGAGQIAVTVTVPAVLPDQWTVSKAVAVAILAQNPQADIDYQTYEATDATNPYVPTITGLDAGDYVVGAWLVWNRPDGKLAYSPAVMGTATVT